MTPTVEDALSECARWPEILSESTRLLRNETLRLRALTTWRPIETAPMNESVLVFVPNTENYGPGIWRAIHVDMGTGKRWYMTALHSGSDIRSGYYPTHWLPLPEPPQ